MIQRNLLSRITALLDKFPIITVTGVRQSGKSTLLCNSFPDFQYVSLEDPDIRMFAGEDPRGFLDTYDPPCILDEVQRVPNLFSYLQTKADKSGKMGEYILSGSHNFLLMQSISQSLAGRSAVLTLEPLSINELKNSGLLPKDLNELMVNGFYPAIYDRNIAPFEYFPSYTATYVERDVRLIRNIPDAGSFMRFIKLLAVRSGQVVNKTELSAASGVSVPTVNEWLSVLMQSYIVFELQPYYQNYSKRLVKSSKIYFSDTGLLCSMLGIENAGQLKEHPMRGNIFETMVVSEYRKRRLEKGFVPDAYFWRDSNQNEVDLLTEESGIVKAYEIKSGATMDRNYLQGLNKFSQISGIDIKNMSCIFSGDQSYTGTKGSFLRYDEAFN